MEGTVETFLICHDLWFLVGQAILPADALSSASSRLKPASADEHRARVYVIEDADPWEAPKSSKNAFFACYDHILQSSGTIGKKRPEGCHMRESPGSDCPDWT